MDGYVAETLARLPLARAVFELFSYVLDERSLGELFERHRGRCYERELAFPAVVHLLRDALLVHAGSGLASFDAAAAAGALPVAVKNVYEKLGRLPLGLSAALLRHATERLNGLVPLPGRPDPLPASLAGFAVIAFDGKKDQACGQAAQGAARAAGHDAGRQAAGGHGRAARAGRGDRGQPRR